MNEYIREIEEISKRCSYSQSDGYAQIMRICEAMKEEQELLFRLPCKVGDTVWFVGNEFVNDYEVRRYIVDETGVDCIQVAKEIDGRDYWNSFSIDDFNKTVFKTKKEAEQALKQMGE